MTNIRPLCCGQSLCLCRQARRGAARSPPDARAVAVFPTAVTPPTGLSSSFSAATLGRGGLRRELILSQSKGSAERWLAPSLHPSMYPSLNSGGASGGASGQALAPQGLAPYQKRQASWRTTTRFSCGCAKSTLCAASSTGAAVSWNRVLGPALAASPARRECRPWRRTGADHLQHVKGRATRARPS